MSAINDIMHDWNLSSEQIDKINRWANINLSHAKELGTGQHGTAYDVGSNSVLKITDDNTEALASSVLTNKSHKNIVNIYKVGKIKIDVSELDPKTYIYKQVGSYFIYLILQEKLREPSSIVEDDIEEILENLGGWEGITTDNVTIVDGAYNFEDSLDKYLDKNYFSALQRKRLAGIMMQIFDGMYFLQQQGIDFYDLHIGNLMFRDANTPVIIDLGISATDKPGKIDILQEYIKKILII